MTEFESIVKGSLVHDIGKLIQRSENHPFNKKHGQWGFDWLNENKFFENDFAINATIMHHKDDDGVFQSNYGLIWYEADNLASSERKQEGDNEKGRWDMFTPLASPFFKVRNPNNISEVLMEIPYLTLKSANGIESVSFKKPEITAETYKAIRMNLEKDLKNAGHRPYSINLLLMLFEKHLRNIPSVTLEIFTGREEALQKHPDISLFDHSKLVAAIAGCMYHFYREVYQDKWNKNKLLADEILNPQTDIKPYLLIGGDISGVQKFIYTITSKGALKSLKGRSFYLELIAEHVVSELIDILKLTRCNIMFSGGGHFYILAYNTKSALDAISNIKTRIDSFLFDEFKGALQLHLAHVDFERDGFKNAVPIWSELSSQLESQKKKKWIGRLHNVLKIEGQHNDCLTGYCEVCFREDVQLFALQRVDESIKVCRSCYEQYQLGDTLIKISKSEYPVIYKFFDEPEGEYIKIEGDYYQIKKALDKNLLKNAKAVYCINNMEVKHYSHPNTIYMPVGIYKYKKLDELSNVVSAYGINRIAVLRMDVDNLGRIFSESIHEDDRTFSRMASISRGLNQFFKYHLNDIVEGMSIKPCDIVGRNVRQTGRKLSVVYSGGDDLFIIGHWLDIIETAYDINRYFREYTGNKFITISGGIAINHEHHPIYQFARGALEAEERAKKGGKDALTLFSDVSLSWKTLEEVIERIRLFKSFLRVEKDHLSIEGDSLPKTFFYRLLSIARRFKYEKVLVLPKVVYLVSKVKGNSEDVIKIKEVIMTSSEREWKITEIATLIVLMLMRKGGVEDARA